jgi:CheY-like chemotaxis protein
MNPETPAPAVLVMDTDRATRELLREWLTEAGWTVVEDAGRTGAEPIRLVLVDVPFPRRGPSTPLQRVAAEHAGTPVLALSATFNAGIVPCGEVARSLGVACVLPKPIVREALLEAVRKLSRAAP